MSITGLQGGKALLGIERNILDLAGIAQGRGSHGLADVYVQAGPVAAGVRSGKTGQAGVDAAHHLTALLDGIKRLAGKGGGQKGQGQTGGGKRLQTARLGFIEHKILPYKINDGSHRM
jgi:hypothetical protein